MLYVPIEFDAIPQLRDQGVTDQAIREVLIRVASKYTPIIQKSAPVDTGALRRSLRVELLLDDTGVAVTSNIKYAGFVEYGTRRMRPRSYVERVVPDLINYANSLLSELGAIQSQGFRQRVNDRELDSGEAIQRVGSVAISQIRPVGLVPKSIRQIRVSEQTVDQDVVSLEFVA